MQPIYAYQEYGITKVYAQTVFFNQPIGSTSKPGGKMVILQKIHKNTHITHTTYRRYVPNINKKEIHNFSKIIVIS